MNSIYEKLGDRESSFSLFTMTISLPEFPLVVKLFYKRQLNAIAAFREFQYRKKLQQGPASKTCYFV